jgi:hypothetical protein
MHRDWDRALAHQNGRATVTGLGTRHVCERKIIMGIIEHYVFKHARGSKAFLAVKENVS